VHELLAAIEDEATVNLTAKRVAKLLSGGKPGNHYDGQGLRLEIRGKNAASWSARYQIDGVERWMGLGSARVFTLAEARERNRRLVRQKIADRIDPVAVRRAERSAQAAAARAMTFAEAAERFIAEREAGAAWSNPKHAAQWPATLKAYALPVLGPISVDDITSEHIFKVLEQKAPARNGNAAGTLWNTRTETAARLRSRIEAVLDWATARKYRSGDNPASWKTIGKVLVRPQVVDDTRHAALPLAEIPALMSHLRQMEGVAARALEFLVLTATRSNEVLGARWHEVDFGTAVWTVPPERMGKTKPREEHRVPLVAETLQLLHGLNRDSDAGDDGFVFIGRKAGAKLGSTAMMDVLERMGRSGLTVHGFRSSFRDWAAERTRHPPEVAEHALAHVVGGKTQRAYLRTKLFPKRVRLMADWAKYCSSPPVQAKAGDVVVSIGRAR
jgi:integrase